MRQYIRFIAFAAAALCIAAFAAGCSQPKKYKIGISQCSSDDWRKKMNEEILREAMLHDNVEVEIRSADDCNEKQIADLDYFVKNGFDLIAVAPNEADALTPKIKDIYESGKPVIVFDRTINGDTYTAFQGADNFELGAMAAAVASTLSDEPRIMEIKGLDGSSPAELRHNGFHHAADSLGMKIIGEGVGQWNYEEGRRAADSILALHPEVNIIYAHNDRMALGAGAAAAARGRKDIRIIGIDAAPEIGIKAVEEGKLNATFLYPTAGHELMRTALAILNGDKFERNTLFPTPAPVNASNAEILLLQDKALREETNKILQLQGRMADWSQRYTRQSNVLIAAIAIILLAAILIFVLTRFYWNSKHHRRQMEQRNNELARQRDQLERQRDELERQRDELARQRDELDNLYRQLQEATGSKLTFFTNVSHDLRTPLTLIADPVSQLAAADNLTERQHTLMQLADKNVKRLERLINQILDIRKYDSGQLKLNLVNINLSEAMREWVAPFANMAAKQHIKFNTDIQAEPEVKIAIDVEKTERILFNLLSNAFKFTPENGRINISLRSDDSDAIIEVSDSGIGMSAEEMKHLFERFFKTDRINPNGSGIGLALSKVFIDMHGGSIAVKSDEGRGSTFIVKFPLHKVDDPQNAPSPLAVGFSSMMDVSEIEEVEDCCVEIPEDTPTLLIIDDNRDICTLVKNVLSGSYAVITASSGAQGIRVATRYVPDLIICDVMMPGMNGYEVCKALKNEELTSHIPVLLLTACSRDEQRVEGYDCGADAFMTKPFDSAMLLARCRSLLENRRLIYKNLEISAANAHISEEKAPKKPAPARPENLLEDDFLRKFREIVEGNIANSELSVEGIAGSLGLSRVQLYRKVKALTNCSAAELIRNIRLKKAAVMLKTSTATVSEIAYAVGFSSPGYFSRCYKEYYHETPAETQNRTSKAR